MNRVAIESLAWAIVHFVWQGAAIALVGGGVNVALGRARPQVRYVVSCCALAAMLLAPAVTFVLEIQRPPVPAARPIARTAVASPAAIDAGAPAAETSWMPGLVLCWVCGVLLLSLRALGGFVLARRLARWKTALAGPRLQLAAARLRLALGVRRSVRILSSAAAEVPATLGWLRPVVLLPVSALTSLTPEQIELLLAHELAHVRRHDYLVNLAQTAVETLLFYHPAVWWISGQIRAEREHCCDDLAVAACGDVVLYANTLATLERLRAKRVAQVVAANGGSLLARIERLAGGHRSRGAAPPAWIGALLPAAAVLVTLCSVTPKPSAAESAGFLQGLAEAGYTKLTVDEIIALREHGVDPRSFGPLLAAGLGIPDVPQLIKLREHGVDPEYVASVNRSGLVNDLDFSSVIALREQGVEADELGRIRTLGFGPYTTNDVVRLRQNGVDAGTFEALLAAGMPAAGVDEAIEFRQNGITAERILSMKRQGFTGLTLEQILKLARGGVI
jgi:beta-lactamase regulating signal transducer with metallopeptidase domain